MKYLSVLLLLTVIGCSEPAATARMAVPSFSQLAGDLQTIGDFVDSSDGESINTLGEISLNLDLRYTNGTTQSIDLTTDVTDCPDAFCDVDLTITPGDDVVFDLVAELDGKIIRRGVTQTSISPVGENLISIVLWEAAEVYTGAADGFVQVVQVIRQENALMMVMQFDQSVEDPARVAADNALSGQMFLDMTAAGLPLTTDNDGVEVDYTHTIDLRSSAACNHLIVYPLVTDRPAPRPCAITTSFNGESVGYLPYLAASDMLYVRIDYDLFGDREQVLAGTWRGDFELKNGDKSDSLGAETALVFRP